jgi:hypothetical protein
VRAVVVILALAAILTLPATAGSKTVRLSGQLSGFSRPSDGALNVLAINANNRTVAGVVSPTGSAYGLTLPAGPYLLDVQDEDFRVGTSMGLSDVIAGAPVNIAPGGPPALAAAAAPVIVIRPMKVTAAPGSGGDERLDAGAGDLRDLRPL